MTRIEKIRNALAVLNPTALEIEDQSHQHAGHAGAASGLGHFRIHIISAAFAGRSPIAQHRLVYETLGSLMKTDIHALSIQARATDVRN